MFGKEGREEEGTGEMNENHVTNRKFEYMYNQKIVGIR
jgi:hypothetical protein